MANVYWGCNGCHKTFGPVESESDIPAGHVCSDECAEKYAKLLDKEQVAREQEAVRLAEGTQDPPKFHTKF